MNQGYVKLYRKALDSGLIQHARAWQFFSWCLLRATHRPHKVMFNGALFELGPGQLVASRETACACLAMTPKEYRCVVGLLEKAGCLAADAGNKGTVFSIVNWNVYQTDNQGQGAGVEKTRQKAGGIRQKDRTGNRQSDRTGIWPGIWPDGRPGNRQDAQTGIWPGIRQSAQTGDWQNDQPGGRQSDQTGDRPDDQPGGWQSDQTGDRPDDRPDDQPKDRQNGRQKGRQGAKGGPAEGSVSDIYTSTEEQEEEFDARNPLPGFRAQDGMLVCSKGLAAEYAKNKRAPAPGLTQYYLPVKSANAGDVAYIRSENWEAWIGAYGYELCLDCLKKAYRWCLDNPLKVKTPRGIHKFLGDWINREHDSPRPAQGNGPREPRPGSLKTWHEKQDDDVWARVEASILGE